MAEKKKRSRRKLWVLGIIAILMVAPATYIYWLLGTSSCFADQNEYIRRPSKAPLCRIVAERERNIWWGFVDRSGKVVVEPLLYGAEDFSEDYALVTVDLERVAIAQDGTIALHSSPGVLDWQQRKRSLPPANKRQCFIDVTGKVVSKLFDAANTSDCYLADGVALVQQTSGTFIFYKETYGYINKAGDWVVTPTYPEAHPFHEGLGRVRPSGVNRGRAGIRSAGLLGYVDVSGKLAIPAQFVRADDFHEGLAAVSTDGRHMGYIDKSGKMVIKPRFRFAWAFHDGMAAAQEDVASQARTGYIDKDGNWAIPPKYSWANEFSEGFASVDAGLGGESKLGFIDRKGLEVVPPQYDWVRSFSCGLAAVGRKVNGTFKCGYIGHDGNIATALTLDEVHPLADGMGRIKQDGKYGFVDSTGKIVIVPQYEGADDFFGGLALVTVHRDGKALNTCINASGKIIWQESPVGK